MKRILIFSLLTSFFLLSSCGNNVTITTPQKDAEKCEKLLNNCNSLREIDKAEAIINKYHRAYEKAIYKGKITGPQYQEFLMNAPNDYQIEGVRAYVIEFGYGPNH